MRATHACPKGSNVHRSLFTAAAAIGSPGLGDPFFPFAGNGGYDVGHYALTLAYDRDDNRLAGTAVISATATEALSRFDLDLRGFAVSRLEVNGRPATFAREGEQELVITPSGTLPAGGAFTVTLGYARYAVGGDRPGRLD